MGEKRKNISLEEKVSIIKKVEAPPGQARAANIPINGTILKEKALQISLQLGMDNFKASNGWIDKFRQRHGGVYKSECGESKSVDEPTVAQWIQALPNLIQGYKLRDITLTKPACSSI
ncbi:tigger transposable element-derived protein 4-like [Schistocerca nitens]|uniref:tigger transposable element-derived protein 4-like n=1 Tax=Schistocerca nitens TaxID=7011 RepID=UPI00211865B9|nr:tigger transposable element-derived protein 4-like [Schistocerca nitens]